jgi:hypothetical protein
VQVAGLNPALPTSKQLKLYKMGMYTELIFGARLKNNTPKFVIDTLKYMLGEIEMPNDFPFPDGRIHCLFTCSSYYFGVNRSVSKMWFDEIAKQYSISTRSNIKNYEGEIEIFLDWIKPYIESGSGEKKMYAIVTYEEGEPVIYSIYD